MASIRLTKIELRSQQRRLNQLERYLPTLQLKKAMLQVEVYEAREEVKKRHRELEQRKKEVADFAPLMGSRMPLDIHSVALVDAIEKGEENIAGVEIPLFKGIRYQPVDYALIETPAWLEGGILLLRARVEAEVCLEIAHEKRRALEEELRQVSIRVNLFEKVLIPRCQGNIKRIKVFLSDRGLEAVSMAKVSKGKKEKQQSCEEM